MLRRVPWLPLLAAGLIVSCSRLHDLAHPLAEGSPRRNVILFVADGLRPSIVSPELTPTFTRVKREGVEFRNSHAMFPTLTTVNAAAFATGHYPGDTGDFSNNLYAGYPLFAKTFVTPLESNQNLGDLDVHYGGNWLDEESVLATARAQGYNTAAVGKAGPTLIQDVTQGMPGNGVVPVPTTAFIDDETGSPAGLPLSSALAARLQQAGLALVAPGRDNGAPGTPKDNGDGGDFQTPGTTSPNTVQLRYFLDTVTKGLLPAFSASGKPFVLVYWSRDPDGTQHNQGDSLNQLTPGINGPTSKAAVHLADDELREILAVVDADPTLAGSTDVIVAADHGFSTVSRHDLAADGRTVSKAWSASLRYADVVPGFLPPGFLSLDVAHFLGETLFDPDAKAVQDASGTRVMPQVKAGQHPKSANGVIGGSGHYLAKTDAKVVVAANGGSDLIYLPNGDPALARKLAAFLATQDYVSGLFADDALGDVPGALPLSAINLQGHALLPTPSLVVNFRSFTADPSGALASAVDVSDVTLQQGQGTHGSFSRSDTWNFMAAMGPDFKAGFVDHAPASNADLGRTIAQLLRLDVPTVGTLRGRVLDEALPGGPERVPTEVATRRSAAGGGGAVTILNLQKVGAVEYYDAAGFAGKTVGLEP